MDVRGIEDLIIMYGCMIIQAMIITYRMKK